MAQATDYVLANQSGANFRSELNSVLAAVVSQNSGSTAPSTTYAYQWWIDTGVSPALLKLRNGANNAWITIGDVTLANLGLVSTTGATFTGDITLNAQSDVRFADSDSSNYVALQAPSTVSTNVTFTLPSADGTADQVLKTDGLGVLGFASYLKSSGGTLTGDVTLNAQSDLRFADSDSSNWVALQAPATITNNVTWTLPATDGTSGQALSTNGSGTLSWAAVGAGLDTAQTWTKGQRGEVTALTSASTVTIDMADSNNFSLTLGHSVTFANPSNLTAGQSGAVVITQASSGGPYTVSYGTYWKFPGGTIPTKTSTASSVCVLVYYVESTTRITAQLLNDVKV